MVPVRPVLLNIRFYSLDVLRTRGEKWLARGKQGVGLIPSVTCIPISNLHMQPGCRRPRSKALCRSSLLRGDAQDRLDCNRGRTKGFCSGGDKSLAVPADLYEQSRNHRHFHLLGRRRGQKRALSWAKIEGSPWSA